MDCFVKLSQLGAPLAAVNSEPVTLSALALFHNLVARWQTVQAAKPANPMISESTPPTA